jgi:hypothetical protein
MTKLSHNRSERKSDDLPHVVPRDNVELVVGHPAHCSGEAAPVWAALPEHESVIGDVVPQNRRGPTRVQRSKRFNSNGEIKATSLKPRLTPARRACSHTFAHTRDDLIHPIEQRQEMRTNCFIHRSSSNTRSSPTLFRHPICQASPFWDPRYYEHVQSPVSPN